MLFSNSCHISMVHEAKDWKEHIVFSTVGLYLCAFSCYNKTAERNPHRSSKSLLAVGYSGEFHKRTLDLVLSMHCRDRTLWEEFFPTCFLEMASLTNDLFFIDQQIPLLTSIRSKLIARGRNSSQCGSAMRLITFSICLTNCNIKCKSNWVEVVLA